MRTTSESNTSAFTDCISYFYFLFYSMEVERPLRLLIALVIFISYFTQWKLKDF